MAFRRASIGALVITLSACSAVRGREPPDMCVARASQGRVDCHRTCEDQFQASFLACYGPPSGCTARCQSDQTQCQDAPFRALQSCEGDAADPASCRTRFDAERARCQGDPNARDCEGAARWRASQCWQTCQRKHQPEIERCAAQLKTCLDACVAR
jgi:hypothetical protein